MWIALVTTLPSENATARQRIWRALKASGAAVLRDGVYVMPNRAACRETLDTIAGDVRGAGGTSFVLKVEESERSDFRSYFDRSREYASVQAEAAELRGSVLAAGLAETQRRVRRLRKTLAAIREIDFFPGEGYRQAENAVRAIEIETARVMEPDEPRSTAGHIRRHAADEYHGRVWATRQRPWVDRLASAWLIARFIDTRARFLWLPRPTDCPPGAVGFDFDGATFTHVGDQVTFEVLISSFGLDAPPLLRIAALVHFLDVGGTPPPEAPGLETVLAGFRKQLPDDDALLAASNAVFDGLLASFTEGPHA